MNYENMTDFEINCQVAKAKGMLLTDYQEISLSHVLSKVRAEVAPECYEWFDFCNSWGDAGSIIFDSCIDIISPESAGTMPYWEVNKWYPGSKPQINSLHSNPLRAAMIVYLTMQEPEK